MKFSLTFEEITEYFTEKYGKPTAKEAGNLFWDDADLRVNLHNRYTWVITGWDIEFKRSGFRLEKAVNVKTLKDLDFYTSTWHKNIFVPFEG